MKRINLYIVITIAAISITLSSCSQNNAHDHIQETISLDQGKKWTVHENMMVHIQKMSDDVERTANQPTKDYDSLNKDLLSGIDALTSDCTMKGQAHDELHKWLLPFIGTTNAYSSDMSQKEKKEWFNDIQKSMTEFEKYFQ